MKYVRHFSTYAFQLAVLMVVFFVFQGESFALQQTLTDDATFPTEGGLHVRGASAPGGSAVSFIKFTLTPNLPDATSGRFVAQATLRVYVSSLKTAGSFNVYRVTTSWREHDPAAPTYDTAEPVAIGVPVVAANSYITVDLTALVQMWLDIDHLEQNVLPNYGIALVANTPPTNFSLDSKESITTSHAAQLETESYPFMHNFVLGGTDGHNLFVGVNTGTAAMTGSVGRQGSYNTIVGDQAFWGNTTGKNNTGVGYQVLQQNTTGKDNTATGQYALISNTTGSYNTATGLEALLYNTTSEYNTATGYQALQHNTMGSYNTAMGAVALQYNTIGSYNTATGFYAIGSNFNGSFNTAHGHAALVSNTWGAYNTAIGMFAGYNPDVLLRAMRASTFVGYGANSSVEGVVNSMALGHGVQVTKSNQVVLGNDDVTETLLRGNVGIGTPEPQSALQVNGYVQLALTGGAPPAADCDDPAKYGRMIVDATHNRLYVCSSTGWKSTTLLP